MVSMNRLTAEDRAHILHLLCEGMSIRAVTRLTGASKRKAEGWRKVTLWMHPDTVEDLDRLAKVYDGRERAVAMCLSTHTHPDVRRRQLEEEAAREG